MSSRCRFPIFFSAAIIAYIVIADLVLLPLHERYGWNWTSWPNGLARLLALPGLMVADMFGARFWHRTGWLAWVIMLLASVPIYFVVGAALRWAWRPRRRSSSGEKKPQAAAASESAAAEPALVLPDYATVPPRERLLSRRGLFLATRRTAVAGVAGLGGFAFLWELRNLEITRQVVSIRDLPPSLSGLRIVQLSDIHHGPWTSRHYVRKVVQQANALDPDLVVLTGDYVHQSEAFIAPVVQDLSGLRGRIGVVATLGNHDWWESGPQTMREFAKTDIPLIDNDRLFITPDRKLDRSSLRPDGLCIAGVGDLWEGSPSYQRAFRDVPDSTPRILLSHNPDAAEDPELLEYRPRVDLMLSGHTHGGQVSFPFIGTPITPSKCGNRYVSGLCKGPLCPVYVNRGIGTTIMPMRFGVRPEITVIELRRA